MILAASPTSPRSIATPLLFNEVTREFAADPHLARIKKLLIYACTNHWENDAQRLTNTNLKELLRDLLVVAPTLEQLQTHLNTIVGTLNKSAEYMLIANVIISRVNKLYAEMTPESDSVLRTYEAIAQRLSSDSESLRIKKLLVLACKNTWETNPTTLQNIALPDLIHDLHALTATSENLTFVLDSLVKTLSKQTEYALIAQRISQAFQPLYMAPVRLVTAGLDETEALHTDATAALPAAPNHPAQSAPIQPIHKRHPDLKEGQSCGRSSPTSGQTPNQNAQTNAASPDYSYILQQQNLTDLFDLRLELMQYTNPLRAKILLFSVLHELFQFTGEHESMLRQHELDDLLRILMQTHKLFDDLEQKLTSTSRQLNPIEDYLQVASTIVRVVKPLYAYLPIESIPILSYDENITNLVNDQGYEATQPYDSEYGDRTAGREP